MTGDDGFAAHFQKCGGACFRIGHCQTMAQELYQEAPSEPVAQLKR